MKEYIDSKMAGTNKHKKIKTSYARVIASEICGKTYFEIEYYDPKKSKTLIGYGSYDLNNVFNWFRECFEVEKPISDIIPVKHTKFTDVRGDDPLTDWGWCEKCGEYVLVLNYCPNCGAKNLEE